jgi:hypothetical protein
MGDRVEPRSKKRHDLAFERHKKAGQEMFPRHNEQLSIRRSTRVATGAAPQYREGDGSSSSDIDIDKYRVEPRKRKSTDKGSDDDSSDGEQEIEEEELVPPVQHPPQPGQPVPGMHFRLLEVHALVLPNYVARVDYHGKGMTRRARDQRRIDHKGL